MILSKPQIRFAVERQGSFLLLALFVFIALYLAVLVGPLLEQQVAPVVSHGSVREAVAQPDGSIRFRVGFQKYRVCEPEDIAWYRYGEDGAFEPVNVDEELALRARRPVNRPLGNQISRWMRADQPGVYFATIHYDCSMPWTTTADWGPFTLGRG